jgi:hypothetical protein
MPQRNNRFIDKEAKPEKVPPESGFKKKERKKPVRKRKEGCGPGGSRICSLMDGWPWISVLQTILCFILSENMTSQRIFLIFKHEANVWRRL